MLLIIFTDSADRVKLFMCHGIGDGPVGIRTSQDWNSTHWGTQIPEMPGKRISDTDIYYFVLKIPEINISNSVQVITV